jgi:hypothetical protein
MIGMSRLSEERIQPHAEPDFNFLDGGVGA